MNIFGRSTRFTSELIDLGPLYAIANDRIHSPVPLDPAENWQFWTDPKPDWLISSLKNYPPATKRESYFLQRMLTRDHASGIEEHYDVSNDFYALFLDTQYRFSTCADFLNDAET